MIPAPPRYDRRMCTLALWWRSFAGAPVVVAANRDEDTARPSEPPHLWPEGFYAGRDAVSGGTWLGLSPRGVFCGVTNRWGLTVDRALPSRGLIVRDVLLAPTAVAAAEKVATLPARATNPFGMLVADGGAAFRVDYDGAGALVTPLAPGIAVLANWPATEKWPRTERALALAAAIPTDGPDGALPALERLLADHDGAATFGRAICVHGDRYATVSSTVLFAGPRIRWREAAGNPCLGRWTEHAVPFALDPGVDRRADDRVTRG